MLPPWTPDLPALDLLLSVAELGSLGRAATAHGISQPSASGRLAHLERRLGVPLLVRTSRGSTLTPAGEAVVAWAYQVVAAAHVLTDGVITLRPGRVPRLRVAASLTVAEYLLPLWLLRLRRRQTDLDVAVTVANSHVVSARVRSGRADIGFVESPVVPSDLTSAAIGPDRLVLVVSPDYPLGQRPVRMQRPVDLLDLPLLMREPGSGTRDTFMAALAGALRRSSAPDMTHAIELGSTTTILATARAGGGVGVVSERAAAADLAAGSLVAMTVTGLDLARSLRAVWLGNRLGGPAQQLVEVALSQFDTSTPSS